ncbi:MAG: hypothetical protein Q7S37_02660 [bacterium]|nr:hypothetical protein [bacterium]
MNKDKFIPQIPEPTEEEIKQAISKLKKKYDIAIPQSDAKEYVKLTNELGWWLTTEKAYLSDECITEDIAKEVQVFVKKTQGKDISLKEAHIEAEKSLIYAVPHEKDRIANEIRALIAKYK